MPVGDFLQKLLTGMDPVALESQGVDLSNQVGTAGGQQDPRVRGMAGLAESDPSVSFPGRKDIGKHVIGAEGITNRFGPTVARGAGLGKEVLDLFSGRGFDMSDLAANEIGIGNAADQGGLMQKMLQKLGPLVGMSGDKDAWTERMERMNNQNLSSIE